MNLLKNGMSISLDEEHRSFPQGLPVLGNSLKIQSCKNRENTGFAGRWGWGTVFGGDEEME